MIPHDRNRITDALKPVAKADDKDQATIANPLAAALQILGTVKGYTSEVATLTQIIQGTEISKQLTSINRTGLGNLRARFAEESFGATPEEAGKILNVIDIVLKAYSNDTDSTKHVSQIQAELHDSLSGLNPLFHRTMDVMVGFVEELTKLGYDPRVGNFSLDGPALAALRKAMLDTANNLEPIRDEIRNSGFIKRPEGLALFMVVRNRIVADRDTARLLSMIGNQSGEDTLESRKIMLDAPLSNWLYYASLEMNDLPKAFAQPLIDHHKVPRMRILTPLETSGAISIRGMDIYTAKVLEVFRQVGDAFRNECFKQRPQVLYGYQNQRLIQVTPDTMLPYLAERLEHLLQLRQLIQDDNQGLNTNQQVIALIPTLNAGIELDTLSINYIRAILEQHEPNKTKLSSECQQSLSRFQDTLKNRNLHQYFTPYLLHAVMNLCPLSYDTKAEQN